MGTLIWAWHKKDPWPPYCLKNVLQKCASLIHPKIFDEKLKNWQRSIFINSQKVLGARGGSQGHFCMFGSRGSTFHRWTAAFDKIKIFHSTKKLLTSEGRSSDKFSIEVCRRKLAIIWRFWSIFLFFHPRCSKTFLDGAAS